ncbi:uncharacterized protein LOC131843089 [Achroia grisella]|uniref:uncharacterized protein LOC131843089 n=1 Tax=Achroia grisella TaxID=688607 RepID=UPI0027D2F9A9|nr:uncharacterized protein LOC131843089 [Achroia grisella]
MENPADIASRGVNPSELKEKQTWWKGPTWLSQEISQKSMTTIPETKLEERKQHTKVFICEKDEPIWNRFSTLTRMIRVLSYCRRLLHLKTKKDIRMKLNTYLTSEELRITLDTLIKMVQQEEFLEEINDLKQNRKIKKRSKLYFLSPYLDTDGLLRVGGRIQASQLSQQHKHPIIIPNNTHLTILIIRDAHLKLLHGGVALTINYLRSRYWIISLKQLVKKCYRECTVCLRYRGKTIQPKMGQLPAVRVQPGRAFKTSGVDFAGPIQMRASKGRGQKAYKGYLCLFICMKTKAVHIEAVSDLTSQGFIAAFRRFVSRRGHCSDLYSDNGLNFVGAARELTQILNQAMIGVLQEVAELLSNDGTTWHFIPPRAPNFGGLWEAGIKIRKTNIIKIIGDSKLTFEEMTTLLHQIEACLNSRPICLLNDYPDDLAPLTPGHFLVGEPLISIPEKNDEDEKCISPLNRWRLTQRLMLQFWRRWSREYLHTMQQRHKWQNSNQIPEIDDVVIIKDDLPPTKWLLGRILHKHTGPDGHVRVVTLKCKNSTLKRPISKLIPLPKFQ